MENEPRFVSLPLTSPSSSVHHRNLGSDAAESSYAPSSLLTASYPQAARSTAAPELSPQFQYVSEKQQSRIVSPHPNLKPSFLTRGLASLATPRDGSPYPFSRMYAAVRSATPAGGRREGSAYGDDGKLLRKNSEEGSFKDEGFRGLLARILRSGSRPMKRLLVLIVLNLTYSVVEFLIGVFTRRIGLVSDAFHLSFGCGVLTFSLIAMAWGDCPPDRAYTYGYKRLEVLAAFTNALFLLFLSFSLAVEALHAFVQDESDHKHYLIVSAVSNLLVNLLGIWFFRTYARVHFAYRKAQDINLHSVCLHVLSDSIRSAGVILASWLLSLGVTYAETLCLGLVSMTILYTALPVFKASGAILSQMAPSGTTAAALNKCLRQVRMLDDVVQCYNARFWDLVPGVIVGTLVMQVS
ncbi:hypothetical protein KC19_11G088400 [Ceratodon purpureus]|uniref:Cation efflux protein transmembrane domain-containing protein n=1 Tax=Ceratodon purpureus TaxID=3225 RepID=A0A8T0GCH0_CERPU|nr:hypothetical protein KC19_11G088400 [Ceratodon purpureus]